MLTYSHVHRVLHSSTIEKDRINSSIQSRQQNLSMSSFTDEHNKKKIWASNFFCISEKSVLMSTEIDKNYLILNIEVEWKKIAQILVYSKRDSLRYWI